MSRFKTYLITGTLITAPAFITLYIVWFLLQASDDFVRGLLPLAWGEALHFRGFPGVGLACLAVLLTFVGFLAAGWLGRMMRTALDSLFAHTPGLSGLYGTIKQVFSSVLGTGAFKSAVLVEFPSEGVWTIAFVAGKPPPGAPEGTVALFVPTTPNPTSGYLIFAAPERVRPLDMSSDQALKYVVSMGIAG
ncbi:membrane protein [Alphaproteobacteria bacterium]|nr:membrane protein [Alphaproteobacteria bacterium]